MELGRKGHEVVCTLCRATKLWRKGGEAVGAAGLGAGLAVGRDKALLRR